MAASSASAAQCSSVLFPAMTRPCVSTRIERPAPVSRNERSKSPPPHSVPRLALRRSGVRSASEVMGFLGDLTRDIAASNSAKISAQCASSVYERQGFDDSDGVSPLLSPLSLLACGVIPVNVITLLLLD